MYSIQIYYLAQNNGRVFTLRIFEVENMKKKFSPLKILNEYTKQILQLQLFKQGTTFETLKLSTVFLTNITFVLRFIWKSGNLYIIYDQFSFRLCVL